MRRWVRLFDWDRVQNWLPGTLGISAAILLVVVAANSPTQTNSRPAELAPSQSTALASKDTPAPSQRAPPQTPAAKTPTAVPTRRHDRRCRQAGADARSRHRQSSGGTSSGALNSGEGPAKRPLPPAPQGSQGDTAGRQIFKKCQTCHSMEPGKTLLGPSLAGIVGRKSGADANFNYSPALKQAALTWDAATLDAYLMDPQKIVPGNRMPFPGLKTDRDRKDVIAFLAAPASPAGAPAAANPKAAAPSASAAAPQAKPESNAAYLTDAKYTLRSGIAEGKMVYLGVGGSIDGKANPVLTAAEGQIVQLTLINGEGTEHDIVFPDQDAKSPRVNGKGASTTIVFRATKSGDFIYFCSVPGHQLAGHAGAVSGNARTWRRRRWSKPTFRANPPIFRHRSASESLKPSGSICSRSNRKAGSRRRRRSATGLSTERYRGHSCAYALAIPSTSI